MVSARESNDDGRNTAVLAAFSAVSNLADGAMKILLPVLATRFTESPLLIAIVGMTLTLPWLVTALPVGLLVDRFSRRTLLVAANGARACAVAVLFVALQLANLSLPLLYSMGVVLGVAEVVALTAAAAIVPQAISVNARDKANAWLAGTETVCNEFAGPFVGGLLISVGLAFAYGYTIVAFVASMFILVLLRGSFRPRRSGGAVEAKRSSVGELIQGMMFLWQNVLLRTMSLILAVLCACWGAWLAVMPIYAIKVVQASPTVLGVIMGCLGLGGILGALLASPLNSFLGRRTVLLGDLVGTALMVGIPIFATSSWLLAFSAFVGGFGGTLWTVNSRSLNQRVVPEHLMGRFHAAWRLVSWGALPLGAGAIGLLAEFYGLRAAFVPFSVMAVAAMFPFFLIVTETAICDAENKASCPG